MAIYRRTCPVCTSMYRETLAIVHRSNTYPDGPVDWCLLRCECSHEYIDPVPDDRTLAWLGTAHLEAESLAAIGSGCVVLHDVLGRLRDPMGALRAIRAGLADGGLVVVVEPRRRSRAARFRAWLRDYVTDRGDYWLRKTITKEPDVFHHFSPRSLRDTLERAGFDVGTLRSGAEIEVTARPRATRVPAHHEGSAAQLSTRTRSHQSLC